MSLTDDQIYGQKLDQEDIPATVAENFCPFLNTFCLCWDRGDCQAHLAGLNCVYETSDMAGQTE